MEQTITLDKYKELWQRVVNNDMPLPEFFTFFNNVVASEKSLLQEIDKKYTLDKLKRMFYVNRSKKSEYVSAYYDSLLSNFTLFKSVSYSPFSEKYNDALKRVVNSITDQDLKTFAEEEKKRQEERERKKREFDKAINNPETIEEFEIAIKYKGKEVLSKQQIETYEQLKGKVLFDSELQKRKEQQTIKQVEITADLSLVETTHSQTGEKLYVIKLSDRLSKEDYIKINTAAKRLGGYYSRYNKGFTFKDKEQAEKLIKVKDQDIVKNETNINNNTERLILFAQNLEEKGNDKLNQDRKTNTYRRQRMAASAEADAEKQIYFAKIVKNIAENISNGKAFYLQNIKFASDIETLNSIYLQALYKAKKNAIEKDKSLSYEKYKPTDEEIIENIKYPYPELNLYRYNDFLQVLLNTDGFKLFAKKLDKFAIKTDWSRIIRDEKLIKAAYESLNYLKTNSKFNTYDKESVKEAFENYNRLNRMAITSLIPLKNAIKEFIEFKQINALSPEQKAELELKQTERKFQLDKTPGFFPTPYDLAIEIVNKADLRENDKVLEPSAGIGHLAKAIIDIQPDVDLTCIEYWNDFAAHLKNKGFNVVNTDFLSYKESGFDKIIMNPPFENNQDIEHINHAYTLLNPGGRLVAIMANRVGQNRAKSFFDFVDKYGYYEKNAEGAFKSAFRPTGVNTITVVLDKPDEQINLPEIKKEQTKEQPKNEIEQVKEAIEALNILLELETDTNKINELKEAIEALEILAL